MDNSFCCNTNEDILREVMVKSRLERIDTQEEITIKILLDNGITGLVISSEFIRKHEFKLKKIERLIYIRSVDRTFDKEKPI